MRPPPARETREGISEMLTQADAARLLQCSEGKLRQARRDGKLAYLPGRPVKLRMVDILDWLDRQRVAAKLPADPAKEAARAKLKRRTHTKGPTK